ncbi:acyltransferase domain-containing protein [Streptomyces sp. AJS327]|uniref:acyltransferase domain-containing protein n=1 Tax=Streptomyces sp. AJS327 TaxID=2545265 RepID=UPI0015DFB753|nr:acyltransferase domain-containing protein [Streptomyces sp. AJS327]MBA0050973.1 acyltransferase domain-containing protein [Streptomyces sp. AJS327]
MTTTAHATGPVLLFPGQGGYDGAALHRVHQRHPEVRALLARVDAVTGELFGRPLSGALFPGGEPAELRQLLDDAPWVSQLAVYSAGLAAHQRLTANGVRPAVLVGHSLGEITALVAAGAYTVEDGARVVARRTELAAEGNCEGGSMVAVGASASRAAHMAALLEDEPPAVAAENHEGQTVLSGSRTAIGRVRALGELLHTAVVPLDSPFAFHHPSLARAARRFADFVGGFPRHPSAVPVYSPILGRFYGAEEPLAAPLAEHFTRPVRFAAALRTLYGEGARVFVETGGRATLAPAAGKALSGGDRADHTVLATLASGRDGADALEPTLGALRDRGLAAAPDGGDLRALLGPALSEREFADFWAAAGHEVLTLVSERASAFLGARGGAGPTAPEAAAATAPRAATALAEPPGAAPSFGPPPGAEPPPTAAPTAAPTGEPPAPGPAPAHDPAPASTGGADPAPGAGARPSGPREHAAGGAPPGRQEILTAVRTLYARALEYPEEVLTDDALLEAELGVDSVKQVELLGRATELYGLPTRDPGFQLADHDTLGKVAELIEEGLHQVEGVPA